MNAQIYELFNGNNMVLNPSCIKFTFRDQVCGPILISYKFDIRRNWKVDQEIKIRLQKYREKNKSMFLNF